MILSLYPAGGGDKTRTYPMRSWYDTIYGIFKPTDTHYQRRYHQYFHHEYAIVLISQRVVTWLDIDAKHLLQFCSCHRHCTSLYWFVQVCTSLYQFVLAFTSLYNPVLFVFTILASLKHYQFLPSSGITNNIIFKRTS